MEYSYLLIKEINGEKNCAIKITKSVKNASKSFSEYILSTDFEKYYYEEVLDGLSSILYGWIKNGSVLAPVKVNTDKYIIALKPEIKSDPVIKRKFALDSEEKPLISEVSSELELTLEINVSKKLTSIKKKLPALTQTVNLKLLKFENIDEL